MKYEGMPYGEWRRAIEEVLFPGGAEIFEGDWEKIVSIAEGNDQENHNAEPVWSFSIGNEELGASVNEEDSILCKMCGEQHKLKEGRTIPDNRPSGLFSYRCGESTYIAAIDSKLIPGESIA